MSSYFTINTFVVVLLIVAVVAMTFTILYYRKKARRAVENAQNPDLHAQDYRALSQAHSSVPTPSATSGFLYKLAILVMLLFLCVQASNYSQLKDDYVALKANMNDGFDRVCYSVHSISSEFTEALAAQNSLVTSCQLDVSDYDFDKNTCDGTFRVSFREIPSNASVQLTLSDNTTIDLQKQSAGIYSGTAFLPLKNDLDATVTISVHTDTVDRAETYIMKDKDDMESNVFANLIFGYLPKISCSNVNTNFTILDDETTTLGKDEPYTFQPNISIDKVFSSVQDAFRHAKKAELVYTCGEKEYLKTNVLNKFPNDSIDMSFDTLSIPQDELKQPATATLTVEFDNGCVAKYILFSYDKETDDFFACDHTLFVYSANGELLLED